MSRQNLAGAAAAAPADGTNPQATRETVESIVVAIILAFLFRAFVAEAFVIPTGSMAPTLQGRHLDLTCVQCGFQYRTGASMENEYRDVVTGATCPICRYHVALERTSPRSWLQTNRDSFNGDRILVSKFSYELTDPERWDVIVFKYPGNAKQNYIKRLIGLPNETIRIQNGDIFVSPAGAEEDTFQIARKPPAKVQAMLQLVDDTRYIGDLLLGAGWPSRWIDTGEQWEISANHQRFRLPPTAELSWLRYRHLIPRTHPLAYQEDDWLHIEQFNEPHPDVGDTYTGQLISDYYAYNDYYPSREPSSQYGTCWVGDLAIDAELEMEGQAGEVWLELIEGGVHFRCQIDVASGQVTLSISDPEVPFTGETQQPEANISVGPGRHRLQFANVDDQLLLWVDSQLVEFAAPTTFDGPRDPLPAWSPEDPGDLQPLAIGGRNIGLDVTHLRVWRDVYYQAVDRNSRSEYIANYDFGDIPYYFATPHEWTESEFFRSRRTVEFELGADQYFPLGDNSPQSKDARLWSTPDGPDHYVERRYLLGKALVIYWPHAWRPFLPNFSRMGLIR